MTEALEKMVRAGELSMLQMADALQRKFHEPVSRNRVAGKIYRKGWKGWRVVKAKPHEPRPEPGLRCKTVVRPPKPKVVKWKPGRLLFLMGYKPRTILQ